MTERTSTVRSLLLVALMVMSVFAGTIAFTGSVAAATADTANSSISPSSVNESTTNTHTVTLQATGVNTSGDGNQVFAVKLPSSPDFDTSSTSVTNFQVNEGNVTYDGTYNVDSTNDVITVTLQDDSGVNSDTVNVTFDITNLAAPGVSGDTSGQAQFAVDANADGDYTDSNDSGYSDFQSLTVKNTASDVTADADVVLDATDDTDNGTIVFIGQSVAGTNFDIGEKVVLRKGTPGDSQFKGETTADDDGIVTVSTADRTSGDYFLEGQDSGKIVTFELAPHDITTTLDPTEVGNAGDTTTSTYEVTTNRGGSFDAYVTADGLSASQLARIFDDNFAVTKVDLNDDGENDGIRVSVRDATSKELNFTGISAGNYTLTTDVVDTTATDTVNVTVTKVGAGQVSLGTNTVETQQGDVASITVDFSEAASSGTLVIGDLEEAGYQANVTLEDGNDDGVVTVQFNTYTAGNDSYTVVSPANSEDTAELKSDDTDLDSILDSGDYGLAVSTSDDPAATLDSPNDLGTLYIAERSTTSLSLWTAPASTTWDANDDDAVTAADIAMLADEGSLTQDSAIATSDYVILEVDASGLGGVFEAHGSLQNAIDNGSVSMSMVQTNPLPNRDPKALNVSASSDDMMFVQDAENDTYYVAIDVGDASFGRMNDDGDVVGSDVSVASGNKFNTSFTVADDRLLGSTDADAHESVYANVEFVAPSVSLDSTPVSVKPASGQKISGTSTYAPGTTFTVRVRSTGDTQPRFYKPAEVTVQADGTWTATFDFSGQVAGDTFQVTTTKGDVKADGSVSESTPTPSPSPTPSPTPTASPTPSPTPGNGGTSPTPSPSPTETTTPGFGAAIAIVALLAAALLAVRRD